MFTDGPPEASGAARVVTLGERYVVPPYGDAHTHMLSDPYQGPGHARMFEREGVLYALVVTDRYTWAQPFVGSLDGPATVDAAYSHGGWTSPRSHPVQVYEWQALRYVGRELTPEMRREIHESTLAEDDAYFEAASLEDIPAKWETFLSHEPDIVKVYLMDVAGASEQASGLSGLPEGRGLTPEALREVIRLSHAAGLRVVAHVETGADVRLAVESGIDGFVHMPGYGYASGSDEPYLIGEDVIAASGARGLAYVPTSVVGKGKHPDRPVYEALARDLHRRMLRALHAAGARIGLGADRWGQTSRAEADFMEAHRFFDRATLLDLWTRTTPEIVFPGRAIGRLAPGYEASLLALDCDPLADWACTRRLAHVEKQGVRLGGSAELASAPEASAEATLRYTVTVEPEAGRVRVDGLWAGRLGAVERWAAGTDADAATVEEAWETPEGVRFAYAIDLPPRERENSLEPSLSARRLRAWQWGLLRYPVIRPPEASGAAQGRGATPEGAVSVAYRVPEGWRAATAFGDAASGGGALAPSLGTALRSPVLAGDVRLVEVPTEGTTSRLAVRAGHPVPDSVFALGFRRLVRAVDAYVGGRETPRALFAAIDLLEGKPTRIPGNFVASPEAASFVVLQGGGSPADPGFWGTIAHEYLHGWTPVAFAVPDPAPVEGRLWPWFREGLTNYLAFQVAHRAGLLSDAEWAEKATQYVREYAPYGASGPVTGDRAYSEGFVIGLALDAAIVRASGGERRLRDWFALLLDRHAGRGAAPLTRGAMRLAAVETGGGAVGDLFDRLTSEDPAAVRAALADAATGSGLRIEASGESPGVALGPGAVAVFDPSGADGRVAFRQRLQRAYDAAAPFVYPVIPSVPVAAPALSDFARGLGAPAGGAWAPFSYGDGSDATAAVEGGALRVEGRTGPGFTGAGAEVALGTPDEAADLGAYSGIEIDVAVAEEPLALQVLSASTSRLDRPAGAIGPTEGRTTLRFPWGAFAQRAPVADWFRNASGLRLLVSGRGEKTTAFTLYGVRLYHGAAAASR